MAPQRAYASAVAYLLDRESDKITPVMLYPITRLELLQVAEADDNITKARAFNAEGDGPSSRWQEVTP